MARLLSFRHSPSMVEHVFDIGEDLGYDWPPALVTAPPEEVIDCLVEEECPGDGKPVRWSEYVPDGLLADMLSRPSDGAPEHREFESLERVGAWERVIAWAQAGQVREMTSFMRSAEARNTALGASTSQAYESAVAEVGLMLAVSSRTAAFRVGDAWSLCTRLPGTLAALEQGRITLAKARVIDAEAMNLSEEHTAAVEQRVLAKAGKQTPGQLRVATRRAVLTADPTAARKRAERARRERGVQMWPEPDGMATLSAYLPAAEATGVFAVLDEHARHAGSPGDERTMEARRADALVDLVLTPTGSCSQGTSTAREHTTEQSWGVPEQPTEHATEQPTDCPDDARDDAPAPAPGATSPAARHCACGRPRGGTGVDVRVTIPYTALLGAEDQPGELAGYGPIPALRWPGILPPGALGGASSPTRHQAAQWITAPPATAHQPTSPDWSSPETRPASSPAAAYRPTAAISTTTFPTTRTTAPAPPARPTSVPNAGDTTK